jgi:peptidyl-tRNA hydrolase, PTH1 family
VKALLGLGNPGSRYQYTWHNFGFWVLDKLAEKYGVRFEQPNSYYEEGVFEVGTDSVYLIKPLTFMNRCGDAAKQFSATHPIDKQDMLVVTDDVSLPLGKLRIREGGSSGGHLGLESVILQLGYDEIPRLRCGVGQVGLPKDLSRFVLARPSSKQVERVEKIIIKASQACDEWVREGTNKVMNFYNGLEEIA